MQTILYYGCLVVYNIYIYEIISQYIFTYIYIYTEWDNILNALICFGDTNDGSGIFREGINMSFSPAMPRLSLWIPDLDCALNATAML